MQDLRDERGEQLIPHGWERYWTEHSERATMPSALAALGIEKSERDLLGRWTPEGSDQYVRTYNAVVGRLQAVYGATKPSTRVPSWRASRCGCAKNGTSTRGRPMLRLKPGRRSSPHGQASLTR